MSRPYSASVKIVDRKGRTLYLRRSPSAPSRAGEYEYPGGHIERGELPKEAALREVREETGIKLREDELRLIGKEEGKKGQHYTYLARVGTQPKVKVSFEHDGFVWHKDEEAKANPNFISRYFAGKDTSGMTTEQKVTEAAVGVGTTAAIRAGSAALKKKTAQKVAARSASKFVPFVGQAMMVYSAAPEAAAVAREASAHTKKTLSEAKTAKGVVGKAKALAKGAGATAVHSTVGAARVGAAAFVGSDVVKMGREAAQEKLMARKNGAGGVVFRRLATRGVKKAATSPQSLKVLQSAAAHAPAYTSAIGKLAAQGAKVVGAGAAAVGLSALAIKGAKQQVGELKKPAASNPSSVEANRAEIAQMLKDMPSDWRSQYNSGRRKLSQVGGPTLPTNPSPEQAMQLIGITAGGNASGDNPVGSVRVPDAVREEAMHGLRLSHKNDYGAWDFIGIARAIQLAISPGVSPTTRKRMRNYFSRHRKDAQSSRWGSEANPSRGWMAWLNWGGNAGFAWVNKGKENPMQVRQNFLFGKADPESMDAAQRAALLTKRFEELGRLNADRVIVRAPAKPGLFGGRVGPAYYMVSSLFPREFESTSEYGMPVTYTDIPSAGYLTHAFAGFSKTASAKVALVDAYTGAVRRFDSISDYNAAVKAANGDWKALMAKNNRGRKNPVYVTPRGQAIDLTRRGMERQRTVTSHTMRKEIKGTEFRIVGPDPRGHWHIVEADTGLPTGKYATSLENAKYVLEKLIIRTNPTMAAFIGDGRGLRVRDLIPPSVQPSSTKKKGKKTKKNPSREFLAIPAPRSGEEGEKWLSYEEQERRRGMYAASREKVQRRAEARASSEALLEQLRIEAAQQKAAGARPPRPMYTREYLQSKGMKRRRNPSPGITQEMWLADVAGEEWANWDLNRAGIMHYSPAGIPTYRSIVKK